MTRRLRGTRSQSSGIRATSGHTGLRHELINIPALEQFRKDQEKFRRQKEEKDLRESLAFVQWYSEQEAIPFGPDLHWKQPVFRLMYGDASPLSIMGSLGAGGRFNAGMAQMSNQFPKLKAQACLYAASSLKCCYSEAQPPYGSPRQYQLVPKKTLVLWDLRKVLQNFGDAILEKRVRDTPLDATWAYQKVPMTSQLLVHELRRIGGDGVAFPSTKCAEGTNLAFFINSDEECETVFDAGLDTVWKLNPEG
jgi:hypothetical protein